MTSRDKRHFLTIMLMIVYMVINVVLETNGLANPTSIAGFDVDSTGRVYISKVGQICVYDGQEKVAAIRVARLLQGRVRCYIMIKDDLLYVTGWDKIGVFCYDLDGNYLGEVSDMTPEEVEEYALQTVKVHNGIVYEGHHLPIKTTPFIIPYTICEGDVVIHRMVAVDYLFSSLFVGVAALVIFANVFLIWRDNRKESKSS